MRKTTVYLPDELKERLEATARRERRSEADLIPAAIEQYEDARGAASPTAARFDGRPFTVLPADA
jgi:predicted transcriptional regulator